MLETQFGKVIKISIKLYYSLSFSEMMVVPVDRSVCSVAFKRGIREVNEHSSFGKLRGHKMLFILREYLKYTSEKFYTLFQE